MDNFFFSIYTLTQAAGKRRSRWTNFFFLSTPSHRLLASGGADGQISIWDTSSAAFAQSESVLSLREAALPEIGTRIITTHITDYHTHHCALAHNYYPLT